MPYALEETSNWGMNMQKLKSAVDIARKQGKAVRGLVFINPGNPTGQCLRWVVEWVGDVRGQCVFVLVGHDYLLCTCVVQGAVVSSTGRSAVNNSGIDMAWCSRAWHGKVRLSTWRVNTRTICTAL